MKTVLLCALAIALGPAAAGQDQGRQDFNGRWIAVEPGAVAGHELRISQDDATLTLEQVQLGSRDVYDGFGRQVGEGSGVRESTTYRLDGKPTIAMRAAADPQQVRSSAWWEDDRLVLADVYTATGLRYQRTLGFDDRGRLVLIRRAGSMYQEPATRAGSVLEPARIVFERR